MFRISALDLASDRRVFSCGVESLDTYFAEQVGQDVRRRVAACFVASDTDGRIAGYYTLAASGIALSDLPRELSKRLPRYPIVPAVRLGRLAIDTAWQGRGLGAALLADSLQRCVRADIAAYAMIVDAKDDRSARFYRHHGFRAFSEQPLILFLPLASISGMVR